MYYVQHGFSQADGYRLLYPDLSPTPWHFDRLGDAIDLRDKLNSGQYTAAKPAA